MKRKLIHIALVLFLGVSLKAQLNLVPNPSFEENNYCPSNHSDLDPACKNWFTPMGAMSQPNLGSSEYFHECAPVWQMSIPMNDYGYQYPRSGKAYAGFALLLMNQVDYYKEYIEIELKKKLVKDYLYNIEFYYSISNEFNPNSPSYYPVKLGAILTDTILYRKYDTLSTHKWQLADIIQTDQMSHLLPIQIDTTNWIKISIDFTANGGEKYLTIGNFDSVGYIPQINVATYVYIDDVSLTYIGPNTSVAIPEIRVYPNPAKDKIYIKQEEGSLQGTRFELYDLNGRLMIHYTNTEDNKEITLPVWHLSSSVYLYAIRKDGELLKMDKLVVLR